MAQRVLSSPSVPALATPLRNKTAALVLVCLAQLMVIIDVSVVNVALPSIKTALHFSEVDLLWVVNAYTLIFAGFLLLGGRAADLIGRRSILIAGLTLFTVASFASGFAESSTVLVVARAVQGLGGALISPAALSILTVTFSEGAERNRALAIWGSVAGGGSAVGVILGGLLTQGPGWRWVFFVNVPIGILTAVLAARFIAESRDENRSRSYDALGAITATAGLVLLVYALVNTTQYGWGSLRTIGELAGAAVLLAVFLAVEARFAAQPLVPLSIFRSRTLSGANAVALLLGLAIFAVFYFLSLYMQQVLGFSPLRTGIAYLPITMGFIVAAAVATPLIGRFGVKWLLAGGMVIAAIAFLLLAQLPDHGNYAANILPAFIVLPLGAGIAFLSVTNAAVAGVDSRDAGLASALLNTSQQVGGAVGLGVLSTIAASRTASVMSTNPAGGLPHALVAGFQVAFLVAGAIAVIGAILAALTIPRSIGRTRTEPERESRVAPGSQGIAAQIAAVVDSWEGAASYAHDFGDIELRAGERELGYLHGDTLADLRLPAGVRDRAIASGVAHPHHVLPDSDWVSMHIHTPDEIHEVTALLRSAYEWAVRRPIQSPVAD